MNTHLIVQKMKASGLHFLLSLVVITAYLSIVFLLWYPEPFASLEKVADAAEIVIGVDLVLGPLLTFLLYKKNKPGLKTDLTLVVLVQLSALFWGVHVTYKQRPVYMAYAEQMFSVVAASDLQGKQPADAVLRSRGWGDQRLVFIELPENAQEKLQLLLKQHNIYTMVDLYRPYTEHLDTIMAESIDMMQRIEDYPEMKPAFEAFLHTHGGSVDDYAFIPVEGRKALAFVVLQKSNGKLVDIFRDDG